MKISEINETISIIANIGVIGSIVFLGLEMQKKTAMMQSQTRNSIVENQLSYYERVIDSIDFARVATAFRANGDAYEAGTAEDYQYSLYSLSQLRMWENEFYQYQIGLFDSDEFEARTNTWKRQISYANVNGIWTRVQDSFAPDFQIYLNGIVDDIS